MASDKNELRFDKKTGLSFSSTEEGGEEVEEE